MATETQEQREAFTVYLELRSARKVATAIGRGEATALRWASKFGWVDRADAVGRGEPDPGPPGEDAQRPASPPRSRSPRQPPPKAPEPPRGPRATTTSPPAEPPPEEDPTEPAQAQRIVRRGMEQGLGHRDAKPEGKSQEARAVRRLWVTAVKTILSNQCDVVRGVCPHCKSHVELPGCGQAPNFKPSTSDVERMMRLMKEIEAEERAKEEEADDRRSLEEVANSIARHLEQLGGLDLLTNMAQALCTDSPS